MDKQDEHRKSMKHWIYRALIPMILFITAFCFRAQVSREALPYTHSWDEPFVIGNAINVLKTGDLNPHFQTYPGGYIYMEAGAVFLSVLHLAGQGKIAYPSELLTDKDTHYLWTITYPEIHYAGRLLTAVLGSLLSVFTWFIGRRFFSPFCGLIAALFVCFSPSALKYSSTITTDIPAAFFMTVSLYWILRVAVQDRRQALANYFFAGLFMGLAIGMKYNAAIGATAFFLAQAMHVRSKAYFTRGFTVFVLTMCLTFLAVSPYAVLDTRMFLKDTMAIMGHYAHGTSHAHGLSYWGNFKLYWSEFRNETFTSAIMIMACAGVIAGFFVNWRSQIIVVFLALIYIKAFTDLKVHFLRNMMPVLPLIAILAAQPGAAIWKLAGRRPRIALPARTATTLAALAIIFPLLLNAVQWVQTSRSVIDSRQQMLEYLIENVRSPLRVAIDQNLHMYFPPAVKAEGRIVEANLFGTSFQKLRAQGFGYLVRSDKYVFGGPSDTATSAAAIMNSRFTSLPVMKEFGSKTLRWGPLPTDLKIALCDISNGSEIPASPNTLLGLTMSGAGDVVPQFSTGALEVNSQGQMSGVVEITSPTTEMIAACSGMLAGGSFPIVRITAGLMGTTETVEIAKERTIGGWNTYPDVIFPCALRPGKWRLTFELLNPLALKERAEGDRVFGVRLIRFR